MPGNRDPFAAFLCDETALDVLRPVVIELGWQPEKCNKGGLRNAIQSLSVSASPNILMVDLSESGDPLNDTDSDWIALRRPPLLHFSGCQPSSITTGRRTSSAVSSQMKAANGSRFPGIPDFQEALMN